MKKRNDVPVAGHRPILHIDLFGAILLSIALVATASGITYALARPVNHSDKNAGAPDHESAPAAIPPWGELVTYDIRLEQPEEYLAFELDRLHPPIWNF